MWRFVTGAKPPKKRAKMSDSAVNYEHEKRKRKPRSAWKVNRPWLLFREEGMVCSYCVDANVPENKTEFVKGCKTARIDSVRKHETSEMHMHAAEVLKNRMKEVSKFYLLNKFAILCFTFVFH
jgi:hypothetical protein